MTVRIRGIYATALTERCREDPGVVLASPAIVDRFDATFPVAPAAASVETSDDRLGVHVTGDAATVSRVVDRIQSLRRDALAWLDPTPRGGIYAGEVRETRGGGAVLRLARPAPDDDLDLPHAGVDPEGFLPYSKADRRVETGDRLVVQVTDPVAPWLDDRPVLDTEIRVHGSLADLVRDGDGGEGREGGEGSGGSEGSKGSGSGGFETLGGSPPTMTDVLPTDPLAGWRADWAPASEEADLDAMDTALAALNDRARSIDDALAAADSSAQATPSADADQPAEDAPRCLATDERTAWVRFGRETQFALDEVRREVTTTMPGHHRLKAGTRSASGAVDLVEALLDEVGQNDGGSSDYGKSPLVAPPNGDTDRFAGQDFPFATVTRQFGPGEGDRVAIRHGKPDGRAFSLGQADVIDVDPDGTVTLRRELSGGGTYDGLGVQRQAGDVATTKVKEGRWWYPTVYESAEGDRRGTYVNVCTPVAVHPDAIQYVDLHVDVVKHADGTVERVDDDELDAAVDDGYVPAALAAKARDVASAIAHGLE